MDSHYLLSPTSPALGGLALFWKPDVEVCILSADPNFINTSISFIGKLFNGTFVYGAPEIPKKLEVWEKLSELSAERRNPWFLTGDFNEITDNSEKARGRERPESSFSNFRSFLSSNDLFVLKHTRNFLSWRGTRSTYLVHCRLDRAIANSAWSDLFPNARSHYLAFEASDHRPLLSTFDSKRKRSSKIFRYDIRLRENEEVKSLISKVWADYQHLSVHLRIQKSRQVISVWSKQFYVNSKKRTTELKVALDSTLTAPVSDDENISRINKELLMAYKAEEEYWKQRSRLQWLTLGDKNTSFFHATTKGRRARNRISVLEDSKGLAVFEDEQIANTITQYFKDTFTSSGNPATEIVQKAITPCISTETNDKLTCLPSAAEIKEALFAIHPDKASGPDGFSASFFQSNWEAVGTTIVKEIQCFFTMGSLPLCINETHI